MNVVKVDSWTLFKRLLIMFEEYHNQTDVYDCTFPVLAGDIARQFSNTNSNVFYMITDNTEDIGFISIYLDTTMLHNEMWVDAAYIRENHRKKGLFRKYFIPILIDLERITGIKRTKFSAKIEPDIWKHITGREVSVEKIMVVDQISEGQDA